MKTIPLTKGKSTFVDDSDYETISRHKWTYGSECGAHRKENGATVLLHRQITSAPTGMDVDHANGNRLDNRKSNLRICTRQENLRNAKKRSDSTNPFKGIHKLPKNKWRARIKCSGQDIHLGVFDTAAEAHSVYCIEAAWRWGEFARFS